MNEETEGNKKVKELFEGMGRILQIIKRREEVERDNLIAYEKVKNDPDNKKVRNELEKGKDHHLYLIFASTEIWDNVSRFPEDVLRLFTPEPFNREQLACQMRNTLEGKLKWRKVHSINSTARATDPLMPVARDSNFFYAMNDLGQRGPDQEHNECRAMGHIGSS